MHVVSRCITTDAAGMIEPRGRAIALNVAFTAGVLLLNIVPITGMTNMLSPLTALIAAFGTGRGSTRGHSWLYRPSLATTRQAFLLSAAGWLLTPVARYGEQDWLAMLPGVACDGARAATAWRVAAGRLAQRGPRVDSTTLLNMVVVVTTTLLAQHTAGAGRSGVCFALTVLLDLSLLSALIVRIRQLESTA